ncbi:sulfate ABC transporter substrate-binding protein [Luteolibacter sp. LG18]|uniref:sulfate ABC transporter substrate-binding protein n=1 Tax=Luteolibacter sp. LG18 TaxID=2819286 RepID=UPI002B2C5273|nr:sulfate ABC transporter substrate-binding protein [Luteolibacter sp. LG18]
MTPNSILKSLPTRRRVWRRLSSHLVLLLVSSGTALSAPTLLNASYDVTREFYKEFNDSFAADWKAKTGETPKIDQSHGGSSKQARSVLDGLEADVVTMNQSTDIEILAKNGLVAKDWAGRFSNQASPYTSTIVFLVRKGNPKGFKDWDDLVKPGVQVIIPNPKTSGNGRYSYLAAWSHAKHAPGGSDATAKDFVTKLFKNVPVLDAGGRGATTTFAQREIGDVLLTFENEAHLAIRELGADKTEIVYPTSSVLAEAPVAVVEKYTAKHGTQALAKAYLDALYTPAAQELAAKHKLRPRSAEVLAKHTADFPALKLYNVDEEFGGWATAQQTHFADGGIFDQIYAP